MNARAYILEKRARLVAEAEAQRYAVGESLEACRGALRVLDRGIAWAKWLRARPYLVVAAAAAIAVLRPKLALAWSARLVTLWRVGRLLYEVIRPVGGPKVGEEKPNNLNAPRLGSQGGTRRHGPPSRSRQAP